MKKYLDLIKVTILVLLIIFVMIFIACVLQEELNPLKIAIMLTGSFAVFLLVGIASILMIFIVFNYLTGKNLQINKLSKVDFLGNKELYRDILKNYSPVMLAYLDQMQYDYDTSIVIGLLSLQNKGFIEIKEEKINVIKFDFYNLNLPERYIIENIKNGKVKISKNDSQMCNMISEEGKRKNLLISKKETKIFLENFIKLILLILISNMGLTIVNRFIHELIPIEGIIKFIFSFGWIYICFYTINYQLNPYVRNKEAEELNGKLEGLKRYLKDYSFLKDRDSQDIVLWEDYLIYSVIFKQNKSIISEYRKYYNNDGVK